MTGTVHRPVELAHADINAAENILDRGMKELGLAAGLAVTAHGASALVGAVKCEAPKAA